MTKFNNQIPDNWANSQQMAAHRFRCGYCGEKVSSAKGIPMQVHQSYRIYICTDCHRPNYFEGNVQVPGEPLGDKVDHVPVNVIDLYEEARRAASAASYTSAVLTCRKLLMHIAVEKEAEPNQNFVTYINYLDSKGYTPPNSKEWVDLIRSKGNEANHEIVLMTKEDAEELLIFSGMLLKFIYEFPNRIKKTAAGS